MKKILLNIVVLIVSLLVVGGIIYLGQYFTKLKLSNQALLNSLEASNQNSFSDWSNAF